MNKEKEYFTRIPNDYIHGDIKKKYGLSRKFYITYILIDRYRSYEDFSWITIREVLNFYGCKTDKHRPKAAQEILDVLKYMVDKNMIEVKQDLDSIGYDTGIKITIIPENFDAVDNFCKISASQLDAIMTSESSVNKESLLLMFLYIKSYIYTRPRSANGNELMRKPSDKPEAFWRCVSDMAKELSMSKDTIYKCLDYLTNPKDGTSPLLIKKEVGSLHRDHVSKPPQNVPSIFVINKEGYAQEIEWALDRMLEIYNVKGFAAIRGGNKQNATPTTENN